MKNRPIGRFFIHGNRYYTWSVSASMDLTLTNDCKHMNLCLSKATGFLSQVMLEEARHPSSSSWVFYAGCPGCDWDSALTAFAFRERKDWTMPQITRPKVTTRCDSRSHSAASVVLP
jgi:hypothetical protein